MQARRMPVSSPSLRLAAVLLAWIPAVGAAEPRPSWECLPNDTMAMVRMPRPAGFLEMLRTRTRFGSVVLGADRVRQAWELAIEQLTANAEPDDGGDLDEWLAKHGLGRGDMEAAFGGEMGLGVVMRPRDGGLPPLLMALAWVEPGGESAERMVAALHTFLAEVADVENPPQRVDLELAGHPVTWVSRPILQADLGKLDLEGEVDAARLAELQAELAERAKRAPKVAVGKTHFFLARLGGRLVVGQTLPQPPSGVSIDVAPGADGLKFQVGAAEPAAADPDAVSGTDEARGIFERFLAAHAGDGDSAVADALQLPGMRDALPPGDALVEALVDPRPLLKAAMAEDANAAQVLAAAGVAGLGPLALRIAFDEGRLRQGVFASLPAPRAGLFRILEQDCDATEVPSFVTREAVDFTQISLDLAQAYRTVKEFAVAQGGEQAANMFMVAEAQAQGWLGLDLEGMLANLGSRHWIVTYPTQVAAALAEARRNREAEGVPAPSADRLAVVWKLRDDAPVIALLPKIAALAQAQVVEEQGFQGVRLPGGGAAIFAGQGHLVVGMGGDALEKTLAGIRNPPAGPASLRESDVPRKGAELVGGGPARMFSVGDATRTGGMIGELRDLVTAMAPDDVEEDYRDLLTELQALVPPAAEMEGMFGVGAAIMEVNDVGVAIRSAWEMPAP